MIYYSHCLCNPLNDIKVIELSPCNNDLQKLEEQEQQRLERLHRQMKLPQLYRESIVKDERRRTRAEEVQRMKLERALQSEAEKKEREIQSKEERRRKLKEAVEAARLREQARRNSARAQQELAEMMAYEKHYGRVRH